jgi:CubicO group peptidase (beta-lactamase class C family)
MKNIYSTFILIFFALASFSQNFDKAKMDSLFATIESHQKGMGSVSIFVDGKPVYQNTIGYADIETGLRANAGTKYRIGSISKTFTAVIIMQLIDEDKLTLDTKLSGFFPEIPNAGEITIENLLRHRSGLYNFTNAEDYVSWMEKTKSRDELIQLFIDNGTVFNPNEKAEYSNTNYVLLSLIAEKIDHKNFSDIIKKRISKPLKLKNTYYGGKINPENNEALSYTKLKGWTLATETDMSIPMGAGSIVSTPNDLNTFYASLFAGKLVSASSLGEMTKLVDSFGIGLFQIPFYERKAFGHTGGIDGFQSNSAYFPDDKFVVSYFSNGADMPVNNIMIGVLSIYFGKDYILPEFLSGLELNTEELDKYLGTYSSPTFPLKLTITKEGNKLIGQATGQPTFPLEAYEMDKFKFDQAMLKIDFFPNEHKLILKQGGLEFELTKED